MYISCVCKKNKVVCKDLGGTDRLGMKNSNEIWERVVDASIPHQTIIPNTYKGMAIPHVFSMPHVFAAYFLSS